MISSKLNIIFLTGQASYPTAMAGAKRVQHAIDALKIREDARQIGHAGRQRAIQLFDRKVQGETLYDYLQTLVSSPISEEN